MTPQLALYGCTLFILVLLYLDNKRRPGLSGALWLAVAWLAILASRPVSAWLVLGIEPEMADNEADGNSIDRNVFLFLILAGLFVLKKRNVSWSVVIANNRWLFLFYLFFACSTLWSDYSFIALKRWFKDLGNVVMVLVILTERDPIQAVRAVFLRCAYVLIPLSVLFIKYYPELGKTFTRWDGRSWYQGVTLGKNLLGAMLLVLILFIAWELLLLLRGGKKTARRGEILAPLCVGIMGLWLLKLSNSATSLACVILGSCGLAALSLPFVRARLRYLLAYGLGAGVILLILSTVVDLKQNAAGMLGRDPTLTGRNEIWKLVLEEKTNPIIGTGFYSFWLGSRSEKLSEKNNYHFLLNQAHNGYLELYLNGGVIAVCLLLVMLFSAGGRIKQQILVNPDWAAVRLVFLIVIMFHNWSEASFCRSSPLWFALLLVVLEYPRTMRSVNGGKAFNQQIGLPNLAREAVPS